MVPTMDQLKETTQLPTQCRLTNTYPCCKVDLFPNAHTYQCTKTLKTQQVQQVTLIYCNYVEEKVLTKRAFDANSDQFLCGRQY